MDNAFGWGYTKVWWESLNSLKPSEMIEAKGIIEKNEFRNILSLTENENIIRVLQYYTLSREQIGDSKSELSKLKMEFDKLARVEKYGIFEAVGNI